jgi:short-subunit dehydrogenase
MNTLIVGGTSGLGLEIARNEAELGNEVIVTGRHDPKVGFAEYREFDLSKDNLPARIGEFVMNLPTVNSLVYAAGYYQEGRITDLSDEDVDAMINVGGRALIFFTKKLLDKQNELDELVTVTSTSQWTPRELEPVYNFVKAGAGHYSHGQALDERIGKTLVVGPSGMDTEFWNGVDKDTSKMMKPEWVAKRVMELRQRDDKYIFAKILGATGVLPQRVEVVEPQSKAASIGALVRNQRELLGASAAEIASLAGISRYYLICIEKGKSPNKDLNWQASRKTLVRICEALNMDADQVLITGGYAPLEQTD